MKNIFKAFIVFLLVFLLSLNTNINIESFSRDYVKHNNDTSVLVEEITINSEKDSIYTNETLQMSVLVGPENASDKTVTWAVKNETGEATISESGLLTPVKIGTVTVRAIANDGSGIIGSKQIEILPVLVTSFEIVGNNTVQRTKNIQFSINVTPEDAYNKEVEWSVENLTGEAIISIDGLLVTQKSGVVKVKATTTDGSNIVMEKEVTITPLLVTNIILLGDTVLSEGKKYSYIPHIYPLDADNQNIVYSIENGTGEASVDQNGYVTAVKEGTVTLVASSTDDSGIVQRVPLTINKDKVEKIILRSEKQYVQFTQYSKLYVDIYPKSKSDTGYTYSYYPNPTYDDLLFYYGNTHGIDSFRANYPYKDVTIVATANDGSGVKAEIGMKTTSQVNTAGIIQTTPISKITSTQSEFIMEPGDTELLNVSITPNESELYPSYLNKLYYVIEDETIASIDANGRIFAYKNGYTTLKIISAFNNKELDIPLSVVDNKNEPLEVKKITINGPEEIYINKSINYSAFIEPINAANKSVTWSIVNIEGDATIDQNGVVRATSYGQAMIKAIAKDGSEVYSTKVIDIVQNYVTNITVEGKSKVTIGKTYKYNANILPTDADDQGITWSVYNGTGAATITEDGYLTATLTGTVTVIATAKDGSNVSASKEVEIVDSAVVENIYIPVESRYLNNSQQLYLTAEVFPSDASDKSVTWSSSDSSIVSINSQTGALSAASGRMGSAIVTATANDGSGTVASIEFIVGQVNVKKGETTSLSNSTSTSYSSVEWVIENPNILERTNQSGYTAINGFYNHYIYVKGKNDGRTLVSMNTISGTTLASQYVYVYTPLESITVSEQSLVLEPMDIRQLDVTYTPNDVGDEYRKVFYKSLDESIVSVDSETGLIVAKNVGQTKIIVKSLYGNKTIEIPVTVLRYVKDITLNTESINLDNDHSSFKIEASVIPSNATNTGLEYIVEDNSIVSVSDTGLVIALKDGQTTITVKSKDGKVQKTIDVTVTNYVPCTGIEFDEEDILNISSSDENYQVKYNFIPQGCSIENLTWSVQDENIVSVDADGKVKGLKPGITTLTVETARGFSDTITINVDNFVPVTSFDVNTNDVSITSGGEITNYQIEYTINPENATNQTVTYSVEDDSVAIVLPTGLIVAVAPGNTKVTVTLEDTDFYKEINVSVIPGFNTVKYYTVPRDGSSPVLLTTKNYNIGEEITVPEEFTLADGYRFDGLYFEYYPIFYEDTDPRYYNGSFYNQVTDFYADGTGSEYTIYIKDYPILIENTNIINRYIEGDKYVVEFEITPKNALHNKMINGEYINDEYVETKYESNFNELNLDSYYVKFDIKKEGQNYFYAYGKNSGGYVSDSANIYKVNGQYKLFDYDNQTYYYNKLYYLNETSLKYEMVFGDNVERDASKYMIVIKAIKIDENDNTTNEVVESTCDNLDELACTINGLEYGQKYSMHTLLINKEEQTINQRYEGYYEHVLQEPLFVASTNSYNSIKLEVSNSELFDTIEVYRATNLNYNPDTGLFEGNFTYSGSFNASDKYYIDKNLKENTYYYYELVGHDRNGNVSRTRRGYYYDHSTDTHVTDPVAKFASSGSYSFKVTWDKVAGANEYTVYLTTNKNSWSTDRNTKHLTYKNTMAASYSKLKPNKTYYVIIDAERVIRKKNSVSYVGAGSTMLTYRTAPAAPTFYVGKKNYNTIKVDVRATGGAVRYDIYRSTSAKGTYTKIAELNEPSVYLDTNLITTKTYYYKIRACNSEGRCSSYTGEKHAKVTLNTPSITLKASADKNALITYKPIEGANGYEIYWSTNKRKWSKLGETDSTTFEKPVPLKKKYFYRVRAYTLINGKKYYSSFSGIKYITINIGKPTVKIVKADVNKINITYNKVAGTTKYQIYRSTNKKKWTYIGSTENLEFLTTIELNKNYYYKVRSFKTVSGKNYYGAFSDIKTGKIGVLAPKISVNTEDNSINITEARDRTGYYVYRSTDKKKWTRIGITEELNYVDTNYVTRQYYYKVRTYIDVDGKRYFSGYSNIIGIKQVYVPPVDPVEPEP